MQDNILEIKNLKHSYDASKEVLKGINLDVARGEVVSILGPSGCGKTTLLRLIAGLEKQTFGSININNNVVSDNKNFISTEKRDIGLVVQERALFPHLSIIKNVEFGLKGSKNDKYKTAIDLLKLFKVDKYAENYPHEISSGEQQRVAMARAMAPNPKILLMDEPFGALDHALKSELRDEAKKIFRDNGTTAIIVSHDFEDAIAMSDHVLIIDEGSVIQKGPAKDIAVIPRKNSFKIA